MKNDQLFNSTSEPIPSLRNELDVIPIEHEEKEYLYFHDMLGYTPNDFVLNREAGYFLVNFDGSKSITDITRQISNGSETINEQDLLNFIQFLDENRILNSSHFKYYSELQEETFESMDTRPPVCAGSSYPENPKELTNLLDQSFSKVTKRDYGKGSKIKALYAPHIDPRVGLESYIQAFAPLRDLRPKRVVLIATSHYAGLYGPLYEHTPFIGSPKHFETPIGRIDNDLDGFEQLRHHHSDIGISLKDRAHRIEHSIELHLIFLRYLWSHEFSVLPILVSSFDELLYMDNGFRAKKINKMAEYLRKNYVNDEETLFLISGDLAHFGQKFGDPEPAKNYFNEVKAFDRQFLKRATEGSSAQILDLMRGSMDRFRICGFPPLLTFLKSNPDVSGEITSYDLWDEKERNSAVTFGSVLFRKNGKD